MSKESQNSKDEKLGQFLAAPLAGRVSTRRASPAAKHGAHIVLPITSAIWRQVSIVASNAAGVKVWAPSLTAFDGLGWTSMISPSAPAAIDAADIEGTSE